MMARRFNRTRRSGSLLPLLAVSVIGLFGFVGLAVDLGMIAVSRTQSQNAADIAALNGCRTLNNKPGVVNNDLDKAVAFAKSTTTKNLLLSGKFSNSDIQKIEVGQYLYNATTNLFQVSTWTDVTTNQSATPPSGSWTAMRVTLAVAQPTYFMKVFGVTSMPSGATATAVYRPRDVAFVLDMTGSMGYASPFNYGGKSMNPDNLIPKFGHYVSVESNLRATTNMANGDGEAMSRNNYSIRTPGGPPILRNFYFDPVNVATPATEAYPVTVSGGAAQLKNAFHRWSPPESGGNATTYTPVTYDFAGYNAFHTGAESTPMGPTPAPGTFGSMTDSGGITYVGDRYRRADGSINKTDTTWATGSTTTKAATTAIELLGYNVSGSNVRGGVSGTTNVTTNPTVDSFRDLVWETHGYDLNIVQYRADKGNGSPLTPTAAGGTYNAPLVPAADRFVGYSMGPGYWGKTFYVWPPDPRAPVNDPGQSGYVAGDWRRRYFLNRNNAAFNPQSDNNPNTTGTGNNEGINEVLLNTASGLTVSNTTTNWQINYAAVLKWIKSGPQVLPPNLRAGRVLYYSSIPNDVDTSTGTAQQKLDKVFWREYIEYVLGGGGYTSTAYLYGTGDSWSSATRSIGTNDLVAWTGPAATWTNNKPYMRYNDSPNRPRLHFWFGPLSMVDFLGVSGNWLPGTCAEAQCWQLKAGMTAVLTDIQKNHPNDFVGLTMFAANSYNAIRSPMSQNFNSLRNALYYPKSILSSVDAGDLTAEIRPYNSSFTGVAGDEIPNANGSTDPNTGLAYAFNLLSPSADLPTGTYGTVKGRRGAAKVIIFETDGVPNTYRGLSSSVTTMNPTRKGYNTFYPTSGWSSGNVGNGNSTAQSEAIKVVQQIVKPMATNTNTGVDSGLTLPNAPALVYPVAFGDLFDVDLAPGATFRPTALQFMNNIAAAGNTVALQSDQVITGTYEQRITRLKDCMERIFASGVAVSLVE